MGGRKAIGGNGTDNGSVPVPQSLSFDSFAAGSFAGQHQYAPARIPSPIEGEPRSIHKGRTSIRKSCEREGEREEGSEPT